MFAEKPPPLNQPAPLVTGVILSRNEERYVARCAESILHQDYPADRLELLVVDGMSTDGSRAIVEQICARDSRVRLIDNSHEIAPSAMNLGITQGRGDCIVILSAHAEYAADYFSTCVEVLQRTGADLVGGYMITLPGADSAVGRAVAAATTSRFGVGGATFRTGGGEQEADTVPFGCYRRTVFERVGLFDERLVRNQDMEMSTRIRRAGGRIIISPQISVTYYNRSTFTGLRQQAFNNGVWNPYTVYLTGGGLSSRHFIPLAFVVSLIGLALAGFVHQLAWVVLGLELLTYAGCALLMAVPAARTQRTSPLLVALAFAQLHVSYGLGSLWGLLTAPFKFGLRPRSGPGRPLAERRH